MVGHRGPPREVKFASLVTVHFWRELPLMTGPSRAAQSGRRKVRRSRSSQHSRAKERSARVFSLPVSGTRSLQAAEHEHWLRVVGSR